MRRALGYYLIALGMLEIILYFVRDSVPFIARPHAGLLWTSAFVESNSLSLAFVLSFAIVLVGAGVAFLKDRRLLVVLYCIVGVVVALLDLRLPLVVLIFGGGHVLGSSGAGIMLLTALFCDLIPVSLSIRQVTR